MRTSFDTFNHVAEFNREMPHWSRLGAEDKKLASSWYNLVSGWKVSKAFAEQVGCGPGTCGRPKCSKGCEPDQCKCRGVCKGRCVRAEAQIQRKLRNKDPLEIATKLDDRFMPSVLDPSNPESRVIESEEADRTESALSQAYYRYEIDRSLPLIDQLKLLAKALGDKKLSK